MDFLACPECEAIREELRAAFFVARSRWSGQRVTSQQLSDWLQQLDVRLASAVGRGGMRSDEGNLPSLENVAETPATLSPYRSLGFIAGATSEFDFLPKLSDLYHLTAAPKCRIVSIVSKVTLTP